MNIQKFSSEEEWISAALSFIGDAKIIALSGGSTPKSLYKAMGKTSIKDEGDFYQVDERYVPKEDEKSNHKLICETLNPKNFHYFDTSLSIEDALSNCAAELPEKFDLVILGIGNDGHTASLFPNSPALFNTEPVAHTQTEEFDVKNRLTITFPTILNSKKILVLLKGQNKAKVLEELMTGSKPRDEFPAKRLLEHANIECILFVEGLTVE